MIDHITKAYGAGSVKPPAPKSTSSEQAAPISKSEKQISRLLPNLEDKVEISKEGLEAARRMTDSDTVSGAVSDTVTHNVETSWYSVGIRSVMQDLGSTQ